ncbi:ubiquitin-domain-containing protein [Serendipita vermifera]|nr:ubiquitin-domain-containing protein [Serendipita vermifera]
MHEATRPSPSINVFCRNLTREIIQIEMDSHDTVSVLKSRIQDREGIPPDQQRLIYHGDELNENRTMAKCGIEDGSIIDIVLRFRGGKPVIYVLSPVSMDATVSLTLVPEWSFSAIYPVRAPLQLPDGSQSIEWKVRTREDGTLVDRDTSTEISYLYWEAHTNALNAPRTPVASRPGTPCTQGDPTTEEFNPACPNLSPHNSVLLCIEKVPMYLDKALLVLGLHTEARTSFITYWLPDLLKHEYITLRFLPQAAYERAAPISVLPSPASVTRVFMLWRGITESDVRKDGGRWGEAASRAERMEPSEWIDVVGARFPENSMEAGLKVLEWGGMEVRG